MSSRNGNYQRLAPVNDLATRNALILQWRELPPWCWHHLGALDFNNRKLSAPIIEAIRRLGADDAIAEGMLGLLRAAELWQPNKPGAAAFNSWAIPWIVQRMLHASGLRLRDYGATVCTSTFTDLTATIRGGEVQSGFHRGLAFEPADERLDNESGESAVAESDAVSAALAFLPSPYMRRAVRAHVLEGMQFAEIARREGRSRESARQAVHKGLARLAKSPVVRRAVRLQRSKVN